MNKTNIKYTYENRIKYKEISPGIFHSCNTYISNTTKAEYIVKIDENEMTIRIVNVNQRKNVKEGTAKGTRILRRKARRFLLDLGVELERAVQYRREKVL